MMRALSVFLCHASQDKPAVRELYKRLSAEKWIAPWLDEEDLLPGQDFDLEIIKAARNAHPIIICLSKVSVAKEGYVNKEIRRVLDLADEKSEGAIYIIPLRLDECEPSFERLKKLHWADYFTPHAHEKLINAARQSMKEAGYTFVLTQRMGIATNSHQCGTAKTGMDPATSVLDPWLRAHDLENLYVVDSSFFPSSSAMNPALTIAAMALRTAERMKG